MGMFDIGFFSRSDDKLRSKDNRYFPSFGEREETLSKGSINYYDHLLWVPMYISNLMGLEFSSKFIDKFGQNKPKLFSKIEKFNLEKSVL